jgi:glycosyltransferase involved in cell wall biosynthesis
MARVDAISVIMPLYNAMPYARAAVESILSQTFDRLELVIVNDGSTDGSADYLSTLTDPRVRVLHQRNQGDAAASNAALRAARYAWAARMDADDVALPQRLEKEAAFIERNADYGFVGCGWGFIGPDGRRLRAVQVPKLSAPPRFQPMTDPMIAHPGMLYSRQTVLGIAGYRNDYTGDLDLALRLDEAGCRLGFVPEVLVLVRVLPGGVSSRNYIRQRVAARYAKTCSAARREGRPEPDWESFEGDNWPRGWRRVSAEGARQFRLAGAAWAAGRYPQAAARLLLSFAMRPRYAAVKLHRYFSPARGPEPDDSPLPGPGDALD